MKLVTKKRVWNILSMRYVVFNNADTIKIGKVQTVDSSEDVRIVDE